MCGAITADICVSKCIICNIQCSIYNNASGHHDIDSLCGTLVLSE